MKKIKTLFKVIRVALIIGSLVTLIRKTVTVQVGEKSNPVSFEEWPDVPENPDRAA